MHLFDLNRGIVLTQLLDMCLTTTSTAEGILTKIDQVLVSFDINWSKYVSFGVGNTNVNVGHRNSIKTRAH